MLAHLKNEKENAALSNEQGVGIMTIIYYIPTPFPPLHHLHRMEYCWIMDDGNGVDI
jgi:hypothetical protein